MSLVFAFEEDGGVEINIDVEGTSDTEATEEVNDAAEEVEALLRKGEQMEAAMANLLLIHDHVSKFPVTKAMLHLMNRGGALGSALGINLPAAESDEVIEDPSDPLDSDDVPEVAQGVDEVNETPGEVLSVMIMESIGDRVKGWKDAVVAFFKKLIAKVKEFFAKYFGLTVRLEKRIKEAENKFKKMSKFDMEAYSKVTMDHMTKAAVTAILGVDADAAVPDPATVDYDKPSAAMIISGVSTLYDIDDYEVADAEAGVTTRVEKATWKRKDDLTEKETNSEVSKEFNIGDLKKLVGTMKEKVKDLKKINKAEKNINKTLDAIIKKLGKIDLSKAEGRRTALTGEALALAIKNQGIQISNTKKIMSTQLAIMLDLAKWQGSTITHVLSIIGRIKVKD